MINVSRREISSLGITDLFQFHSEKSLREYFKQNNIQAEVKIPSEFTATVREDMFGSSGVMVNRKYTYHIWEDKPEPKCPECESKWDDNHNRCTAQCGESREVCQ